MATLEKMKPPTVEEIEVAFEKFVTGASISQQFSTHQMKEMMQTGMFLLRHLPCARDAVFDVISKVYEEFVKDYMKQIVDLNTPVGSALSEEESIILDDIHTGFINYLEASGQIWAPILSQWTLHLLGHLSSQYANASVFGQCQSVNEVIQIWMNCKSIQSLLDLTSRSLTCKDHANEDAFISALLDTSATHSPHFDWVVAHVGNSYPLTIVSKVLALGLQNFSSNPPTISKLSSVAGILGHLVTTHAKEVQYAFNQILEDALSGTGRNTEVFSIPFLLQLCSPSVTLLDVLMDSILPKVKGEALDKLIKLVPRWINMHFGGQERPIVALVTHLILKSTRGPKAIEVLMCGCKSWSGTIGQNARNLLDNFTSEISGLLYESDHGRKEIFKNFPCISSLKENNHILMKFLTDMDPQVCRTAKQFVKLLALYDGPAIGVTAACYYLRFAQHDKHLWHLADLLAHLEIKYSTVLEDSLRVIAVKSELSSTQSKYHTKFSDDPLRIWRNILQLVKSEGLQAYPIRNQVSSVLQENLMILTPILDIRRSSFCMDEASIIVEIFTKLPSITKNARFGDLLTLERYLVNYLFQVLLLADSQSRKVTEAFNISQLLVLLCEDQAIQNDSLRSMVQTALDPDSRPLFIEQVIWSKSSMSGFDVDNLCDNDEFQPERFLNYIPLMKENQRRTASISLSRAHSTSLHSGKLAKTELKNWSASPKIQIKTNPDARLNLNLFLTVLVNVCSAIAHNGGENGTKTKDNKQGGVPQVSAEAMRKVALLLVEIVSPDVMFNGLPWPEEEFSKVQVERDLLIRRAFEHHPYLWDFLELVASNCPSLCYCSVLLRALMATLMAHWTSCQESKTAKSPVQLECTIRLINIMETGQLLPPPLCFVGKIVHVLKANEVLHLLRDIWAYMRMNVPVPALFTKQSSSKLYVRNAEFYKVDKVYTEKLRLVVLNNVEFLGQHYPKFFPNNSHSSKSGAIENGSNNSPSSSKNSS